MTTYVQARDALVALINTGLGLSNPGLMVVYENADKVDLASAPALFLIANIDLITAKQATIERNPKSRTLGEVVFRVMTKEGEGTREVLALMDTLSALMGYKLIEGVSTKTPIPGKKMASNGWASSDLRVPFQFDSIS